MNVFILFCLVFSRIEFVYSAMRGVLTFCNTCIPNKAQLYRYALSDRIPLEALNIVWREGEENRGAITKIRVKEEEYKINR